MYKLNLRLPPDSSMNFKVFSPWWSAHLFYKITCIFNSYITYLFTFSSIASGVQLSSSTYSSLGSKILVASSYVNEGTGLDSAIVGGNKSLWI